MTDIHAALTAVMNDVQAVGKDGRNSHGGYSFRGIDAVVNAVGPAFRKHGVTVGSDVVSYEFGEILTGKDRKPMGHARVVVAYKFYAGDGSSISFAAPGEAFDSGDKATPKAMSVAYRTALLQALCLPTDDPDPDAHTYERAEPRPEPRQTGEIAHEQAKARLWAATEKHGSTQDERMAVVGDVLKGVAPADASVGALMAAATELEK